MKRGNFLIFMSLLLVIVAGAWGIDQCWSEQSPDSGPGLQQNLTDQTNRSRTQQSWEGLDQRVQERTEVDPVFRKYVDQYNRRMKALDEGTLISR